MKKLFSNKLVLALVIALFLTLAISFVPIFEVQIIGTLLFYLLVIPLLIATIARKFYKKVDTSFTIKKRE